MKFTKMSLVAALLIGSSAFALDNVQISGDANVFYQTADAGGDLFDKDTSAADVGLNLNATADILKNDMVSVSAGAGYTALTSLGLENNFVSNVWGGAHQLTTGTNANFAGKVEDASWFNEAWVAATTGKTTVKVGRMELDTPLAFTETWSIEKNTFEAAVVINQDISDTVLVGAYVGNGNGTESFGQKATNWGGNGPLVNANGDFTTYGTDGAYAAGVINNSFEPLTLQAWYYDVTHLVQAYWLQADYVSKAVPGLIAGAQYSAHNIDTTDTKVQYVLEIPSPTGAAVKADSDVYAVMLGYEMEDMFTAKVAYSQVGQDFAAGFNTATATSTAQSKLYTEAWWNYGQVTMADTQAYNVTVEAPVKDIADFGLYYTYADHDKLVSSQDLTELTLTASKSFGALDTTLVYVNYDLGKNTDSVNIIQAYLTLNF